MGHVSPGAIPEERAGHDVPRRQHRRARTSRARTAGRLATGEIGERVAATFLRQRGVRILARNVRVGHDEIDLVGRDAGALVAVEVKTRTSADPVESFTQRQAELLRRAATALGPATRCDLITVRLTEHGAQVRWLRAVTERQARP